MDIRKELEEIVKKYNLIERTIELFWINYDNYLREEPEESRELGFIDRDSVGVEYYGYYFGISNDMDFDHIKVYVDGFLENSDMCRDITYWCVYTLDGEYFDDYFIIE